MSTWNRLVSYHRCWSTIVQWDPFGLLICTRRPGHRGKHRCIVKWRIGKRTGIRAIRWGRRWWHNLGKYLPHSGNFAEGGRATWTDP